MDKKYPVNIIVVFDNGTARHFEGQVRTDAIIHEVVKALAKKYEGLRKLPDYDYTPYVNGEKQDEYTTIANAAVSMSAVRVIKIVSRMLEPASEGCDTPQS